MATRPTWFLPVAVLALLWNVAGLLAVVADLRLTQADIAALSPEQQAMYAARPTWSVVASLVAVVGGTLGSLALVLRRTWAVPLLAASLVGAVAQDIGIFGVAGAARAGDPTPIVLQGMVLVIGVALLLLARRASRQGWLA